MVALVFQAEFRRPPWVLHMNAVSDFVWAPGLVCKHLQMSGSGRQSCLLEKWNVKSPQKLVFGTLLSLIFLFLSMLKKFCSQDDAYFPGNQTHSDAVF